MRRQILATVFVMALAASQAAGQEMRVLYFPHFAVGGGTEYADGFRLVNGYEFGIIVQNPNNSDTQVNLSWWGSDGRNFPFKIQTAGRNDLVEGVNVSFGIPANASAQTVFSFPLAELKVGWIRVEMPTHSSGQPSANAFLQFRYKVSSQIIGQATVNPVEPSKTFVFYARRYASPDQDASETGVAMANPNNEAAVVTIVRRDRNGGIIDTFNEVIPPMGQISRFISEMRPLPMANYEGSIQLSSNLRIVALALQTTGNAETFNFSTIPLVTVQ